jgi:hypothetical protein
VALFNLMRAQEHIPFGDAREYCPARAHEMYRIMSGLGIEARKVWNLSENFAREEGPYDEKGNMIREGAIRVEHPAQGTILWVFHVAPTVSMQTPDGPVRMVIDPSLFDGPATEAQWKREQDAPGAIWEETGGEYYKPGKEGEDGLRDDDYSQTEQDLREARQAADEWENGIIPETSPEWQEGIVPGDADDDSEDEEEPQPVRRG